MTQPSYARAPGMHTGITVGVVTKRQDPEKLGRVKVRYPTLGNRESDWLRVLMPYGGAGKHGVFWIPEKDDEVAVAFVDGDAQVPIVVGTLYSKKQKPPSQKYDERVLLTRGNHRMLLSDESGEERVEIKTNHGHLIVISDENGKERIELKTKSGQSITMDEASNTIDVKANEKIVIESATAVDVKTATATISAGTVKLGGDGAHEAAVLGDTFMQIFNNHVHSGGLISGLTGLPEPPMVPGLTTSTVVKVL